MTLDLSWQRRSRLVTRTDLPFLHFSTSVACDSSVHLLTFDDRSLSAHAVGQSLGSWACGVMMLWTRYRPRRFNSTP